MNFNDQDLQCFVTLSAAKGLSRWAERCFAALSMTVPVWIVKNHNRHSTAGFICQSTLSGPSARRLRRRRREKLGGHPQTPARGCAPGPRFPKSSMSLRDREGNENRLFRAGAGVVGDFQRKPTRERDQGLGGVGTLGSPSKEHT